MSVTLQRQLAAKLGYRLEKQVDQWVMTYPNGQKTHLRAADYSAETEFYLRLPDWSDNTDTALQLCLQLAKQHSAGGFVIEGVPDWNMAGNSQWHVAFSAKPAEEIEAFFFEVYTLWEDIPGDFKIKTSFTIKFQAKGVTPAEALSKLALALLEESD